MVCDIQGVGYQYTDPTIITPDRQFGGADLGPRGFDNFFRTHKCNAICKELKLC